MKLELRNNKDFWAGMMFVGTGAGAMFIARHYPFGTTLRMGPGYFPIVLGGILILFGIYVMAQGAAQQREDPGQLVAPGLDRVAPLHGRVRRF